MQSLVKPLLKPLVIASLLACGCGLALASSHREAPFITTAPKVDGADFYAFRSYEAGRDGYVTLIANYLPLQDAYGGPNYFSLDANALYEIHVDNNGDGVEDLTFQFRFQNTLAAKRRRHRVEHRPGRRHQVGQHPAAPGRRGHRRGQ